MPRRKKTIPKRHKRCFSRWGTMMLVDPRRTLKGKSKNLAWERPKHKSGGASKEPWKYRPKLVKRKKRHATYQKR